MSLAAPWATHVRYSRTPDSGDDVFFEERAHLFAGARGEFAVLHGVKPHPMRAEFGVIQPKQLDEVNQFGRNVSQPSLLCIENTHNGSGGSAWGLAEVEAISTCSEDTHEMKIHMDGARIFNAVVAHGDRYEGLHPAH